jgi:hypothetical protein
MGKKKKKSYKILTRKPEGRRALRRKWRRLEGNIKIQVIKVIEYFLKSSDSAEI